MSISAQETQNGNLPGGNGRRMQFGQFQFSTTDATGSLKLNLSKLEHIAIQPTGTVATDETVTPPQIPIGGLVVDSTGTITVSRTGAAKTSGLICSYHAIGWCLLLGMFLLAGAGCASVHKAADGAVAWLDAPASTQPTPDGRPAPTRGQVVGVVLDTGAAAAAPTPAGPIIGGIAGVVALGGLVLRALSSKDHGTLAAKIDDVADAVQVATDHVQAVANAVAPPPPGVPPSVPPGH